jgi:drug/metabolite transporter (DMT)-like permease
MLLWAVLVGLSFPAVASLGDGLPPLILTALRFALAALVMIPLLVRHRVRLPHPRDLGLYAILGFCLAAFFATMFWAGERASALSLATIYVSVPLLTYFLGLALAVERGSGRRLAYLVLGAAGALGLHAGASSNATGALDLGSGEIAFFIGCGATALYPVVTRWGLERGWLDPSAELRTFWSLVAGALLIGMLGLVAEDPGRLSAITARDGWLLVYLAVLGSAGTFWLMQRAAAVLRPATVTAYSYLVPFTSLALLLATPSGVPGWNWIPGGVLVLLAMVLLTRGGLRRTNNPLKEFHDDNGAIPASAGPGSGTRAVGTGRRG